MSAFNRLPDDYRKLCGSIAKDRPSRLLGGATGSKIHEVAISAQNRNVRFIADMRLAQGKSFPNRDTRQQRRARTRPWKRRGETSSLDRGGGE